MNKDILERQKKINLAKLKFQKYKSRKENNDPNENSKDEEVEALKIHELQTTVKTLQKQLDFRKKEIQLLNQALECKPQKLNFSCQTIEMHEIQDLKILKNALIQILGHDFKNDKIDKLLNRYFAELEKSKMETAEISVQLQDAKNKNEAIKTKLFHLTHDIESKNSEIQYLKESSVLGTNIKHALENPEKEARFEKNQIKTFQEQIKMNLEIMQDLENELILEREKNQKYENEQSKLSELIYRYDSTEIDGSGSLYEWIKLIQIDREEIFKELQDALRFSGNESKRPQQSTKECQTERSMIMNWIKSWVKPDSGNSDVKIEQDTMSKELEYQLKVNRELKELIVNASLGKNISKSNSKWKSEEDMIDNIFIKYNDEMLKNADLEKKIEELVKILQQDVIFDDD